MAISWWPPGIDFDTPDLLTVTNVMEEQKGRR